MWFKFLHFYQNYEDLMFNIYFTIDKLYVFTIIFLIKLMMGNSCGSKSKPPTYRGNFVS